LRRLGRHRGEAPPAGELELFLVRFLGEQEVRIEQHGTRLAACHPAQDGFDMRVAPEAAAALVDAKHETRSGEVGDRFSDLGARLVAGLFGGVSSL
jgi:hypothetical protein